MTTTTPDRFEARRAEVRAAVAAINAERTRLREQLVAGDTTVTARLTELRGQAADLEAELQDLDQAAAEAAERERLAQVEAARQQEAREKEEALAAAETALADGQAAMGRLVTAAQAFAAAYTDLEGASNRVLAVMRAYEQPLDQTGSPAVGISAIPLRAAAVLWQAGVEALFREAAQVQFVAARAREEPDAVAALRPEAARRLRLIRERLGLPAGRAPETEG